MPQSCGDRIHALSVTSSLQEADAERLGYALRPCRVVIELNVISHLSIGLNEGCAERVFGGPQVIFSHADNAIVFVHREALVDLLLTKLADAKLEGTQLAGAIMPDGTTHE